LNNEDLVRYVLDIPDSIGNQLNSEQVKKSDHESFLVFKHLRCQYEKSNNDQEKEKIINDANSIFERILAKASDSVKNAAKESFKNSEESFTRNMADSDVMSLCPDRLPQMCAKENNALFQESSGWCEHICSTLSRYKNDAEAFDREVINYKPEDEKTSSTWRMALAFNFKGRKEALKMCDNHSKEFRYLCIRELDNFEIRKTDCDKIPEKLKTELCSR
jgi:hypothetical protein